MTVTLDPERERAVEAVVAHSGAHCRDFTAVPTGVFLSKRSAAAGFSQDKVVGVRGSGAQSLAAKDPALPTLSSRLRGECIPREPLRVLEPAKPPFLAG
jgi:hypothetical protein